jgi:hypothetical protein
MTYEQGRILFGHTPQDKTPPHESEATSIAAGAKTQPAPCELETRGAVLDLSEAGADLLFVTNFWVCDCGHTYRKCETQECPQCGHSHDECPDALADELVRYSRHLLTNREYKEICRELEIMQQRLQSRALTTV